MDNNNEIASEQDTEETVDDHASNRTQNNVDPEEQNVTLNPPAAGDSRDRSLGTTQAGQPRRRIKWTHEMNVSVITTFYRITRNGENLTNYRQELFDIVTRENPSLTHLTVQNVADRRAAIINKKMIPEPTT